MILTSTIKPSLTGNRDVIINSYLNELNRVAKVVTPEQEVELVVAIKNGDLEAREKLIKANLRFVFSIAKIYRNRGLDLMDLVGIGNLGMIKSIERFDETRGFKFISHSVWWIRQHMLLSLAEETKTIRLPLNKNNAFNSIKKFSEKFYSRNERYPVEDEIVGCINNVSHIDVNDFYFYYKRHKSLDAFLDNKEESTLIDIVENIESIRPDEGLMMESLKHEINFCLNALSERDRGVVKMYYGIDCDKKLVSVIADEFNISDQSVRNIICKMIKKFNKPKYRDRLRPFISL